MCAVTFIIFTWHFPSKIKEALSLFLDYIDDVSDIISKSAQLRLFADACISFSELASQNYHVVLILALVSLFCGVRNGAYNNFDTTVFMRVTDRQNTLAKSQKASVKLSAMQS